jgi:hypothetical protein
MPVHVCMHTCMHACVCVCVCVFSVCIHMQMNGARVSRDEESVGADDVCMYVCM